jgi:hypothetical protein
MKDYRELKVWHHAHAITLASYKATKNFPREELFGITSQIRRCAASIVANIAEGRGRTGNAELNRFLLISSSRRFPTTLRSQRRRQSQRNANCQLLTANCPC